MTNRACTPKNFGPIFRLPRKGKRSTQSELATHSGAWLDKYIDVETLIVNFDLEDINLCFQALS